MTALNRAEPDGLRVPFLPPLAEPAGPPVLVGFMDDASFRWHPERAQLLDRAQATGAGLVRALVRWYEAAPERPAPGELPFVEPRLHELDELVASAEAREMEVMLTIWGTPGWANGGLGPNRVPTDPATLREFAHALAERYPSVRRWSVWNEPNIELFLAPQFDDAGRSVSPGLYAALYRAAHEGIREANPDALVAAGETASHGRDEPSPEGMQDRHAPATFAQLLAAEQPRIEFDAWAHHPYPVQSGVPPDGESRWPVVTLTSMGRFADALNEWFERDESPLWVTELAYAAAPDEPRGVPEDVQAEYASRALELAAEAPEIEVFVWFTFADSDGNAWKSGLLRGDGSERPLHRRFADTVDVVTS